jgi:hypothetical protein
MRFHGSRRAFYVAFLCAGVALAACQGNIGGGSGLSIPQAPGYGQPAGPGNAQSQSRERVLDGAVFLSPKLTEVPLPEIGGFSVSIALGTPEPEGADAEASSSASHGHASRALLAAAHASASPGHASPSASASAAGSAEPSAPASGASGQPSAGASSSPSAGASASPKPAKSPTPAPASASSHPHIETKTTIYPDDAPPPPTPIPTGEVQTFVKRTPIVRGYVLVGADVPLYGLGAIHFTMPLTEITPKRGFTIALYESEKHHHQKLMNYDTDPIVGDGVVYSGQKEPVVLKKDKGYVLMIYGDEEAGVPAAAPAPLASGYPPPGNNPFPLPSGSGYPQPAYTQVPGNPYATPVPYNPYATPVPNNPYSTPTPPFGTPHP